MGIARSLAALIRRDREALLADWRRRVRALPAAAALDAPTLNDHVPRVLDALVAALDRAVAADDAPSVAHPSAAHGAQRLRDGYDIEQVVAEYGLLRESLHALAEANGVHVEGAAFRVLNRELNQSIGLAVRAYAHETATALVRQHEQHLAFVTHDLRTPLNAIVLAVSALELALPPAQPDDGLAARMLRSLRRSADQLHRLVDSVVAASAAPQPGGPLELHRRRFELWPLVAGLVQELEPLARASGARLVNAVPDELKVYADANLLGRALRNLIENAIRHAPHGEVAIGGERAGEAIACWVRDDGTGIEAARMDKVFEAGETTRAGNGGMGLGLTIVREIVEAHGGHVEVSSTPGRGSIFRFDLPPMPPGDSAS